MPRSSPPERLDQILRAGVRVFARLGYRRTQMADVAAAAELSVGNLYNYVEGKDALFYACLLHTSPAAPAMPEGRPIPNPPAHAIAQVVSDGMRAIGADSVVRRALRRDPPEDVAAELAEIIGDYYDRTASTRRFQALVEASTRDVPELFEAFFPGMRRPALVGLQRYLDSRIASGHLRPVPDTAMAARLINETQAWFARHRHGDPDASGIDDAVARETVIDILVAGLLPA